MRFSTIYVVMLAAGCCGCAVYHPAPLTQAKVDTALAPPNMDAVRVEASKIHHPLIQPMVFDDRDGLSPEEAAVMAVIANPQLRAVRDQAGLAMAQVIEAGILPNPQLSYSVDVPQGDTTDLVTGGVLGLSWDFSSLLARGANMDAARVHAVSVRLDVAWQEWQAAQAARLHVCRLVFLRTQVDVAREIEKSANDNLAVIRNAAEQRLKTDADLAAAEEAARQAQTTRLSLEQELTAERLALNLTLGLPPDQDIQLQAGIEPPATGTDAADLLQGLEDRRLDLLALKLGYESEESSLRAAVRSQFPKISIGINKANDTSNVRTTGFGVTIDLPFFDRGQGKIAIEKATRQQLFDEYVARVAEARSEVVALVSELESARRQGASAEESLPALERLAAAYDTALSKGNADVLSAYEARSALALRRLEVFKLRRDLSDLVIALEIATGRSTITSPNKEADIK
jgi:outer membrane protein TolC